MTRIPKRLADGDRPRQMMLASQAGEALHLTRRGIVHHAGAGHIPGAVRDPQSGLWLIPRQWVAAKLAEQQALAQRFVPALILARKLGLDKRTVVRACKRGDYPGAVQLKDGRRDWYVPKRYIDRSVTHLSHTRDTDPVHTAHSPYLQ